MSTAGGQMPVGAEAETEVDLAPLAKEEGQ